MTFTATTARSRAIRGYGRLDANFYTSPGVAAFERVSLRAASGQPLQDLRDLSEHIWDPARFARVYATSAEPSVPYLRPYDVFDYLPVAADRLSLTRNTTVDDLRLTAGTILQTCSGRNLGPSALVDDTLARFTLSHDMIRVDIGEEDLRLYVLAYLQTPTGQALLRRGMSGSVIDHITVREVGDVPVLLPEGPAATAIIARMREAQADLSEARTTLGRLVDEMGQRFPMPSSAGLNRQGWTLRSRDVGGRLDAAFHDPLVRTVQAQLREAGAPAVADLGRAIKPSRYRRFYVERDHGRPVLSGRQLLQVRPINLRHVSDRSFANAEDYVLTEGMTIFGGVGRAEGRLGAPALITAERTGWLASEDVVRLQPLDQSAAGAMWLATSTPQVQLQLRALTFGSVVDHLAAEDVDRILLPPVDADAGTSAWRAWQQLGRAEALIESCLLDLDRSMREAA